MPFARTSSRATLAVLALSAAVLGGCGDVKRPDGGQGLVPIGHAAPEVSAEDPAGHEVRLSAAKGKPAIVFFYPADGTPGCTKEACAFRDAWSRYEAAGVVVLGVSTNSRESHRKFQAEHKLPMALAADESGAIGRAYGVSKKIWGYDRVSFLVDREGKAAKIWPSVDPGQHASEVLAEVARLP